MTDPILSCMFPIAAPRVMRADMAHKAIATAEQQA